MPTLLFTAHGGCLIGRTSRGERFSLARLLYVIELALIFFFSLRPATDPDYGWHIANGTHLLDGAIFRGKDLYSWTATDLWIAHEWLTEGAMSLVHHTLGASANSILAAVIGMITYALVAATLLKRGSSWTVVLLTLPIAFAGAMRSVGVRPLMLELLYLSLLVAAVDQTLSGNIKAKLALLMVPAFAVLWANTHGSFLLLPAVLGITAAELLLSRDSRWRHFLLAMILACAAIAVNPWGIRIFGFATQSVSSAETLAYIDEWKRPVITELLAIPLLLQAMLAAYGILRTVRMRLASRSSAEAPAAIGILRTIAFAFLAFTSGRHVMLFGVAAAVMIAAGLEPLSAFVSRIRGRRFLSNTPDSGQQVINLVTAVIVAAVVVFSGWKGIAPDAQLNAARLRYPVAMLSELKTKIGQSDRVFNQYDWGGFLIANGVVPVFIDGRSELYGDAQLRRYARIIHLERGWENQIDSLRITRVIMGTKAPLIQSLRQRGWVPVAADSVATLLASPLSASTQR